MLSLGCLLVGAMIYAQSGERNKAAEFDHTTIYVRDLQKSADFYRKVIGLQEIPEPFKDGKHVWFRVSPHEQLHVVSGATSVTSNPIDVHLAFRVESLADFMKHLDEMQVKYRDFQGKGKGPQTRPDVVKQIYFQDPDGYRWELSVQNGAGER